jgi:hypothetical protein
MTWPVSYTRPWNPPTYRYGSANTTEAGFRRRRHPVGAASPPQPRPDQHQAKPPSRPSNEPRLWYYPVNGHVIGCKRCYLGSDLLNIVNDLTPCAYGSISIQSGVRRGAPATIVTFTRTVLSPPRLWNCRPATTAAAVRLSAKQVDLQMRSGGLQPQHGCKRLTQSRCLCIWVASNCSYLCGAGLKDGPADLH